MGELHPRNRHKGRYDMTQLTQYNEELSRFVARNKYGDLSIDFFDPQAVKELNRALLSCYYGVEYWDIPPQALVPPIPSRADYIHYAADLIGAARRDVKCLDIGVGANCIYPIIGVSEYGWSFVASDIEPASLDSARAIVDRNTQLVGRIELRLQCNRDSIFEGVINGDDYFDLTVCNPPFHDSPESAVKGSARKIRNLKATSKGGKRSKIDVDKKSPTLNFAGQSNELWCEGGERAFVSKMIRESVKFKRNVGWFTSLISKEDNLPHLKRELREVGASHSRCIDMSQGNKRSRLLAWGF